VRKQAASERGWRAGFYVDREALLQKRRAEVLLRVREFYAMRGIEVDDATIEMGVKAYFDRRLTFEAPELTPMQERLARLYITRGRWLGKTVAALVAIAAIAAYVIV
jgi:hypothetical protein